MTPEPPTSLAAWGQSPTAHPLGYPGSIPEHSYVVGNGSVIAVDGSAAGFDGFLGDTPVAQRTAVLAVGSNGAPARLAEKVGDQPVGAVRVTVTDHSVVYSAHIARYGSIAATLLHDPGAWCRLHVCLFTPDQLEAVDRSEGNYARVVVPAHVVGGLDRHIPRPVERYASRWGALAPDGVPVRVAEIDSGGSELPAATQPAMQRGLASRFPGAPGGVDTMAGLLIGGVAGQAEINRWLAAMRS